MWLVLGTLCVIIMCQSLCDGYGEGAPVEACHTLEPLHDSEPTSRESPYHFTAHYQLVNETPTVNGMFEFMSIFIRYATKAAPSHL